VSVRIRPPATTGRANPLYVDAFSSREPLRSKTL
jgi:hypothetical protein